MENKNFDHKLRVYSDITELIASPDNPTPLVRINRANTNKEFLIYLKLERYNPFGSVKDRIAIEMLRGMDIGNKTVVEPSSGNTGIAIASVANARGIPVEIAVPEKIPDEKKVMLKLLGVKLTEADDSLCPLFPAEGARGMVNALIKSPATKDKYVSPNQYENDLNVLAHYRTTGPEIWRQTKGRVTHFFAGFGTCGTITGVGRYLKEQNPAIKIIGVEPSSQDHKLPGLKRITGLDGELVPKILDRSLVDETRAVCDRDAYRSAIELARKDGISAGPTTGAILSVAYEYAKGGKGLAVVISPDDAFKYASFYKEFLSEESDTSTARIFDLCGHICPASKVRTIEIIESMREGETAKLSFGDVESVKSAAMELKSRGIKATFEKTKDGKFIMAFSK